MILMSYNHGENLIHYTNSCYDFYFKQCLYTIQLYQIKNRQKKRSL